MATRIIEFGGSDRRDHLQVIPSTQKVVAQSAMTATGTSAQSSAFDLSTSMVCISSDEAVYVNFGSNPTATANDFRVYASTREFFSVAPGAKVAIRT